MDCIILLLDAANDSTRRRHDGIGGSRFYGFVTVIAYAPALRVHMGSGNGCHDVPSDDTHAVFYNRLVAKAEFSPRTVQLAGTPPFILGYLAAYTGLASWLTLESTPH